MALSADLTLHDSHPLRILIVPAHDSIGSDFIEEEASLTRATLSDVHIESEVRHHLVRSAGELTKEYVAFLPDIVQFTGHGSPGGFVSFENNRGFTTRLTGSAFARSMGDVSHKAQFLFFNGCRVYGPRPMLPYIEGSLISVYSRRIAMDVSAKGVRAFYEALVSTGLHASDAHSFETEFLRQLEGDSEIAAEILTASSDEQVQEFDEEFGPLRRVGPIDWIHNREYRGLTEDEAKTSGSVPAPSDQLGLIVVKPESGPRQYRVWYGTNRRNEKTAVLGSIYGSDRDTETHYGYCDVTIPKYHQMGSIGDPWWKRFPRFGKSNRLSLLDVVELSPPAYGISFNCFSRRCHHPIVRY